MKFWKVLFKEIKMSTQTTEQMIFQIRQNHSLQELEQGGCERRYSTEHCKFSDRCEHFAPAVHLIQIPHWKSMEWSDCKCWAPSGYRPLGLQSLINLGVEYPELQLSKVVVATGAPHDPNPSSAIYYPYLTNDKGKRIIETPNWGVCWVGDNNQEGAESNFYGIFEKIS